jgi:hypothetical protein
MRTTKEQLDDVCLAVAIKEYCHKLNDDKNNESKQEITETLLRILSRQAQPSLAVEPLEELARRKGVVKTDVSYVFDDGVCYSGSPKAARAYLEALKDVKEGE